jgi:ribosomal protein S18 acetylase RimI-like enzyme
MHATINANVRFDTIDQAGTELGVPLQTFFRRSGIGHVYDEFVVPALARSTGLVIVALVERPWPPWGIDAAEVVGAVVVHPLGTVEASITSVLLSDENATNVGLAAALMQATLKRLAARGVESISYVVHDEAALVPRVLASLKFRASDEYYLTRAAKYRLYRGRLDDLAAALGFDVHLAPDLLAGRIDETLFARNALFALATQTASRSHWAESGAQPEMISNRGIPLSDSPPGGIGGTAGPSDPLRERVEIEEEEIEEAPIEREIEREEEGALTRR